MAEARTQKTKKADDAEQPTDGRDQVAMVSRRADGTPDQTPGFTYVTAEAEEADNARDAG